MRLPHISDDRKVRDLIRRALAEDIGSGDVTTLALVPSGARVKAVILSRKNYVISGTEIARAVFQAVDRRLHCRMIVHDGKCAKRGQAVMIVEGRARSILTAERTALNFLQRMSGIASLTAQFVAHAKKHGVTILDTRKTTPNLRILEKYAVLCGGGKNHRFGLFDRFLIKDNHRRLWRRGKAARLDEAIFQARKRFPGIPVEVEIENEAELKSALKAKPEWVLLDNMTPIRLRKCVKICEGRSLLEASGGINLSNVASVAATGVDVISLGCLTHSAPAADLSLEIS
jgi:nicotinate-nucleotide pyrophosphorylase (carboxylating)